MKKQTSISSRPVKSIKTFYVENLGCAKNQVDAEVMIASLEEAGLVFQDKADSADLVLINTCGFIESAKQESIQVFLEYRDQYPDQYVVLTGCFAQRYGKQLVKLLPEADGFFGNRNPSEVSQWLSSIQDRRQPVVMPLNYKDSGARNRLLGFPGSAFVKISEGCSNRCAFCAIPLIRGGLRSRDKKEVLADVARRVERGSREINLIAQDLANYGLDRGQREFVSLCREILEIPGDYWIRLLYIHPDHFPLELLDLCREDPRLLPYFDLPFQHGSRRVLHRMGRSGDAGQYLQLIEKIRTVLPSAVIRSTLMTGFPGETKRDFDQLTRFQDNARIDWVGAFVYSREEQTPAWSYTGPIRNRLLRRKAQKRKKELEERQIAITEERLDRFVGKTLDVLIEEAVQGEEIYLGRGYMQAPEVDGLTVVHTDAVLEPGARVPVRITGRRGVDLEAVLPEKIDE